LAMKSRAAVRAYQNYRNASLEIAEIPSRPDGGLAVAWQWEAMLAGKAWIFSRDLFSGSVLGIRSRVRLDGARRRPGLNGVLARLWAGPRSAGVHPSSIRRTLPVDRPHLADGRVVQDDWGHHPMGHSSQVSPFPPPAVAATPARPPVTKLSLIFKRHVDRHAQLEKRHAGVIAVSQLSRYPETCGKRPTSRSILARRCRRSGLFRHRTTSRTCGRLPAPTFNPVADQLRLRRRLWLQRRDGRGQTRGRV
jgi:hypothetical protein